jgi:hypothetical protein
MVAPLQTSTLSTYAWNATAGRYVGPDGRFVPFIAVRDELEGVIDSASLRMNLLAEQLISGNVSLAEWQSGMMENIKLVHTASSAAANGGWAQMSQSDWGFVGQEIRVQYDYLRNFAEQIASGEQQLNGQVLVRANMYGDAGRGSFEAMRTRYEKLNNGMTEARRVLGAADHCPDCLAYAADGWMPIDDVPAIGDSVCLTNCHCEIEYRRGESESEE